MMVIAARLLWFQRSMETWRAVRKSSGGEVLHLCIGLELLLVTVDVVMQVSGMVVPSQGRDY
jgi:hypothetical protein